MVHQQKTIDQLKKQIRDLRKSNSDLAQQLKTTIEKKKTLKEDSPLNFKNEAFKERLITILESTSDFVSTSTPDFKITFINKAGMRLLGVKNGILPQNLNVFDCHPRWALEIIEKEGVPKAISEGIWRGETALLKGDGTEIPISQVIMSHKSPNGEIGFLSTIIRDISVLKEMEGKLIEREKEYRMLIENIPDVTWKSTPGGGTIFISPNIKDILGYTQKEIIDGDIDWFEMIHQEDKVLVENSFEKVFTDNNEYDIRYRIFSKDGTIKWIHDRALSSPSKEGEKLVVYGIFSDITNQKKAEEGLEYYLEFEKIISKISAELINIPIHEIDNAIENALMRLVQFTNTTRGNLYKFSNDLSEFSCTHEWCVDQKYSQQAFLQKMPSKKFPYIIRTLKKFKPLILSEPSGIHRDATGAKKWRKKYGYRPAIMIPMIFENKLYGMLEINGKDNEKRYWSKNFITLLKFIAEIFVSVLERKNMEEKLRESEGKFRLISEQSLLGILIIQNDVIFYANDAVSNIVGYTMEQIITGHSMDYSTIFHPDDWQFVKEQIQKNQHDEEGAISNYKLRVLPKREMGKIKWCEAYSHSISYFGKPAAMVTIIDITEKMSIEVALKESEEKFRMLSEQSLMGMLIIQDNFIKYCNEALSKISEYSVEEMMKWKGNKIFSLIHPEDRKIVMEQAKIKQLGLKNGIIPHHSYRIITKTGKIKWVDNYSKTVQYNSKSADFITMIDNTEAITAEKAKQESENRYRNLVETMNEGLAIIDINNKLTYVNPKFIQMVGYSRKDLIDRTIFDFFGEKDKMIIRDQLSKHKKELPGIFEMEWHKKDSSKLFTMISTQQILDERGNYSGNSAVITDITDIKQYESELESRTESLEKALKEKESLMRELHHRVKNNLQVISAITLMHEESSNKDTQQIFKEYQNRIKAMAKIHETLYRSEDIENIGMESYVLNLISNLIMSYNVDQERIKIISKIDKIDLNISKAMHYGLIINELISNALKHAFPNEKKGSISVSVIKGEKDQITLVVEDDGTGLKSEIDYTNPSTMGLKMIKISTNQLKGEINLTINNGTKWEITFKEN